MSLAGALVVHVAAVLAAVLGIEMRWRWLLVVGKPLATVALLGVMGLPPWPTGAVGCLVAVGILFSLGGDVALLGDGDLAFMIGLALFLAAHVAYMSAAWRGGGVRALATPAVVLVLPALAVSAFLVKRAWPNAPAAMHVPIVVYASVISCMVGAALLTLAGPWPRGMSALVAGGAVLFYASDAVLAWNRFVAPTPHGQTVTLVLYWAGQLGLALAVRPGLVGS